MHLVIGIGGSLRRRIKGRGLGTEAHTLITSFVVAVTIKYEMIIETHNLYSSKDSTTEHVSSSV